MEHFLIEYKSKIIGTYSNFDQAKLFILSCLQNNLMIDSANILTYKTDSCFCINNQCITLPQSLETKNSFTLITKPIKPEKKPETKLITKPITKPEFKNNNVHIENQNNTSIVQNNTSIVPNKKPINYNDPVILEIAKQKIELTHKINLLKLKKEQIEESKQVYENDIKLFNMFNESKKTNDSFIIPELFEKKYNIINKLKEENKLSWDNFMKENHQDNNYNDYFCSNSYEDLFLQHEAVSVDIPISGFDTNNNFDEEFDIDSDIESESDTESSI